MGENFQPAIRLNILVVGAGISGLAVAIESVLSGHNVVVFEAAEGLHEIGAGINITPNASRILRRWGLSDDLWTSATEPTSVSVWRYSGELLVREKDFDTKMRTRYGVPFIELHRVDFQTALYTRAKELGVEFKFGMRVSKVNFETGEITSHTGLSAKGDLVIAADGLWSLCRAQFLPKDFEGVPRPTGDLAYRLVLTLDQIQDPELRDWLSKPTLDIWLGPHSHAVGYSLRGATEFNIVLLVPDDLPAGVSKQAGSVEEMRALFTGWDPILTKFIALADSAKKWKLMHRREMRKWVYPSSEGNFAFIGDSCHPMLPYLGQGANSAIEDGVVLGRLLKYVQRKEQIGKALEMYEKLRKSRGDAIVKETFIQRDIFQIVDGPKQQERDETFLSQLEEESKRSPFPIRILCPEFQPWLFGYDACGEVEKAVIEDPFVIGEDIRAESSSDESSKATGI